MKQRGAGVEQSLDELVGRRRRSLLIVAVLVALLGYGVWKLAGPKHEVDVSGYHFACGTYWQARFDTVPVFLNVIDVDRATTVTDAQVEQWAYAACRNMGDEEVVSYLLWIVPVACCAAWRVRRLFQAVAAVDARLLRDAAGARAARGV